MNHEKATVKSQIHGWLKRAARQAASALTLSTVALFAAAPRALAFEATATLVQTQEQGHSADDHRCKRTSLAGRGSTRQQLLMPCQGISRAAAGRPSEPQSDAQGAFHPTWEKPLSEHTESAGRRH